MPNMRPKRDLNLVADYICYSAINADSEISVLKLHKLLYYVQAWHLAFFGNRYLDVDFQAWVHGPACRDLYNRYKDTKTLFSLVTLDDLEFKTFNSLSTTDIDHIDNVLNAYMHLTGGQLEALSHAETPWQSARGNLPPFARSETVIDDGLVAQYYRAKIG